MKMFRVTPRCKSAKVQAKLLEAVLNRPEVVDRILDELANILKERTHALLTGYQDVRVDDSIFGQGKL